jgi:enoyl-CoA hydratase/carnithine racemase
VQDHSDVLRVEDRGRVRTLTLSRPRVRNAMSLELASKLVAACDQTANDPDVDVVIVTGDGPVFAAGLDLKEMANDGGALLAFVSDVHTNPFIKLRNLPQVTIAAVNGPAITGGLEMTLACDLVVASTEATFIDTHAYVGILPAQGLPALLSSVIGAGIAKWVSLGGGVLSAQRAFELGLVCSVVPPDGLIAECNKLAEKMMTADPVALRKIKELYRVGVSEIVEPWLRAEKEMFDAALAQGVKPVS